METFADILLVILIVGAVATAIVAAIRFDRYYENRGRYRLEFEPVEETDYADIINCRINGQWLTDDRYSVSIDLQKADRGTMREVYADWMSKYSGKYGVDVYVTRSADFYDR